MHTAFRYLAAISFIATCLCSLPAAAEDSPSVPMVSGGVGDDDYDALQVAKERYNVRMLFTEANGAYLSDVAVTISNSAGTEIAKTVTQGPVLLIKLKPGSYSLSAAVSGYSKQQKFSVSGKGRSAVHVAFPIKDTID